MISQITPMLSKSRFIAGLQCQLRLWHQCYNPKLAKAPSPIQQALFEAGHEVGRLATGLYPNGVRIEENYFHHRQAEQSTRKALGDKSFQAIFEAAFTFDGIRIRVDMLERLDGDLWNLIEVKSSTTVKDVYKPDVGVQYYILKGLGFKISSAGILHINNEYVYDGRQMDLGRLFYFTDLTEEVVSSQKEIAYQVSELKNVLAGQYPPNIHPSRHCFNPYQCEFFEHCTSGMPEFWVMGLSGMTQDKFERLVALHVEDIAKIPEGFPLTALQERIKTCVVKKEAYIAPELANELMNVNYPVHFLDFETIAPVIPRYANTRPYQTIPFQWSDHILLENGSIQHDEYLCIEDKDPRIGFIENLLSTLDHEGTIFIYTGYEKGIVTQLADEFTDHRDQLLNLVDRFKDLHALIRRYYYHPEFYGSFSLKSVLPVLVPSMNYGSLAIQEGSMASIEYLKMLDTSTSPGERAKIKEDLLTYCGFDTLGMVKIRDELLKKLSRPT